jgi:hypothetical protein
MDGSFLTSETGSANLTTDLRTARRRNPPYSSSIPRSACRKSGS